MQPIQNPRYGRLLQKDFRVTGPVSPSFSETVQPVVVLSDLQEPDLYAGGYVTGCTAYADIPSGAGRSKLQLVSQARGIIVVLRRLVAHGFGANFITFGPALGFSGTILGGANQNVRRLPAALPSAGVLISNDAAASDIIGGGVYGSYATAGSIMDFSEPEFPGIIFNNEEFFQRANTVDARFSFEVSAVASSLKITLMWDEYRSATA